MRPLIVACAACLAALAIQACAAERPAAVRSALMNGAAPDTLEAALLDELFRERHAAVQALLAARAGDRENGPAAVEARSLVAAAEEIYLTGRTSAAILLLEEATALLRRNK